MVPQKIFFEKWMENAFICRSGHFLTPPEHKKRSERLGLEFGVDYIKIVVDMVRSSEVWMCAQTQREER